MKEETILKRLGKFVDMDNMTSSGGNTVPN
jgi:hypothetical protein